MSRLSLYVCGAIAFCILVGCSHERAGLTAKDFAASPIPPRHQISNLPFIDQQDFYCGPAALGVLLAHVELPTSQNILVEEIFNTQEKGSFQHALLHALRSRGLIAAPVQNIRDIIIEVAHDNPVLVLQNLSLSWLPQWHYAVVTGYSLPRRQLYLHGGKGRRDMLSFDTFAHTWARAEYWGYVVARPPRLPITPATSALDDIAPRFEALGLTHAAELTYTALASRKPERSQPWFGLGNVYLAQQRFVEAEAAYRAGLELEPQNPYMLNNLAYALHGQGQTVDACALLQNRLRQGLTADAELQLRDSQHELCDGKIL